MTTINECHWSVAMCCWCFTTSVISDTWFSSSMDLGNNLCHQRSCWSDVWVSLRKMQLSRSRDQQNSLRWNSIVCEGQCVSWYSWMLVVTVFTPHPILRRAIPSWQLTLYTGDAHWGIEHLEQRLHWFHCQWNHFKTMLGYIWADWELAVGYAGSCPDIGTACWQSHCWFVMKTAVAWTIWECTPCTQWRHQVQGYSRISRAVFTNYIWHRGRSSGSSHWRTVMQEKTSDFKWLMKCLKQCVMVSVWHHWSVGRACWCLVVVTWGHI